jgi:hypothetical protein
MLEGNRCEECKEVIESEKAKYLHTKYCGKCAQKRKKQSTLSSVPPEDKKAYMRIYMRVWRINHPGQSSPYVRNFRKKKRFSGTA